MARFVTRRRVLIACLGVVLMVLLLLGGRAAWRLGHRLAGPPPPPRQTDVSAIAGWMTVPYVSRAYRVPRTELFAALGVDPESHRTTTLDEIAAETGRAPEDVLETVRATVLAWQASHPGPGPGGPKPDGAGPGGPRPDETKPGGSRPGTPRPGEPKPGGTGSSRPAI